jgi:hypothetical protein
MTDRISYLTVALQIDYRTDDVDTLVDAIKHLRGVADVMKGQPVSPDDWTTRVRTRREIMAGVMQQIDRNEK